MDLAHRMVERATLRGEFRLRSGAVSDVYFDKYLLESDPGLLRDIAEAMAPLLPAKADALAGLEMGGIPVATVLSQLTGRPVVFVRKQAKEYGTCKLAEGGEVEGRRLVLIEDVVTSGGAVLDAARALRERGAVVEQVVCMIDREAGGGANLAELGLSLTSLFTRSQLEAAASGSG